MKIVNLTPHALVLQSQDGARTTVPPSGTVARVASSPGSLHSNGAPVPVYRAPAWGDVEGLPAPEEGTLYVVSAIVASRVRRLDVASPGTGPADGAVRENGQVVAVTRLILSM